MEDCIIIGGGIAGLQAAIQLGRYSVHRVLVIDKGTGRSTLCQGYHNILGWPDGVSGETLRRLGRDHAASYGVQFVQDTIEDAEKMESGFRLRGASGNRYEAKTLLMATGVTDRYPELPGLVPTLGRSVYVCPDCDGYEIQNRKTVVIGSGEPGASMAVLLHERTQDIIYVNHEGVQPEPETMTKLSELGIPYIEKPIAEVQCSEDGIISGLLLSDQQVLSAERGFIAFGGNTIHSDLAAKLGAELEHNRHVKADPRSKQTSVNNLWVAGDLAVHSELSTAAMGDGAIAAIWIHKALNKMNHKG